MIALDTELGGSTLWSATRRAMLSGHFAPVAVDQFVYEASVRRMEIKEIGKLGDYSVVSREGVQDMQGKEPQRMAHLFLIVRHRNWLYASAGFFDAVARRPADRPTLRACAHSRRPVVLVDPQDASVRLPEDEVTLFATLSVLEMYLQRLLVLASVPGMRVWQMVKIDEQANEKWQELVGQGDNLDEAVTKSLDLASVWAAPQGMPSVAMGSSSCDDEDSAPLPPQTGTVSARTHKNIVDQKDVQIAALKRKLERKAGWMSEESDD